MVTQFGRALHPPVPWRSAMRQPVSSLVIAIWPSTRFPQVHRESATGDELFVALLPVASNLPQQA